MALPLSGQISIGMIRTELGIPNQTNFSLRSAVEQLYVPLNPFSPYLPTQSKLSSWYGYDHQAGGGGLPSGSFELSLSYGEYGVDSCIGLLGLYYVDGTSIDTSTVLYTEYGQTDPIYLAPAGWYSDGSIYMYWTGSNFEPDIYPCKRRGLILYDDCFGKELGVFYLDAPAFMDSTFVYTDADLKQKFEYFGIISDNEYTREYNPKRGLQGLKPCEGIPW